MLTAKDRLITGTLNGRHPEAPSRSRHYKQIIFAFSGIEKEVQCILNDKCSASSILMS